MTTSLLDSLKGVVSPELATRLATSLGEPSENVTNGLNSGMSAMLLGLLGKSGDAASMQQLFVMITNAANDGRVLDGELDAGREHFAAEEIAEALIGDELARGERVAHPCDALDRHQHRALRNVFDRHLDRVR